MNRKCREKKDWLTKFTCTEETFRQCYEFKTVYFQGGIKFSTHKTNSASKCQELCQAHKDCKYWTWTNGLDLRGTNFGFDRRYECALTENSNKRVHWQELYAVSGPKVCGKLAVPKMRLQAFADNMVKFHNFFNAKTIANEIDKWDRYCLGGCDYVPCINFQMGSKPVCLDNDRLEWIRKEMVHQLNA